ncbi:hypothetical protein BCR44DRAFT_1146969 [Catenaria anguillulae PL171]|uniref:Uncharacterized protein n=1 Tax=Catenaria anguillulae PL171 TaxID=765915 RepID=A0A1Y2HIU6_9FUNG|nr:hypothetical protein BCR44DRAFT_1146969 [Catenaria anguillulae PL171]
MPISGSCWTADSAEQRHPRATRSVDSVNKYANPETDHAAQFDAAAIEYDLSGHSPPPTFFEHVIESADLRLLDEDPNPSASSNSAKEIPMRRLHLFTIFLNKDPLDHILLDADKLANALDQESGARRGASRQHKPKDVVHGSGFVGALYVDEDGDEYESQDGDYLFDEPMFVTLDIKDMMVQYVCGEPYRHLDPIAECMVPTRHTPIRLRRSVSPMARPTLPYSAHCRCHRIRPDRLGRPRTLCDARHCPGQFCSPQIQCR